LITIEQIRAARGLLGWSQSELASQAGVSVPTVKRVEAATGPRVSQQARDKLRQALEAAGIEFIAENGGGVGVRLHNKRKPIAPLKTRSPEKQQKITTMYQSRGGHSRSVDSNEVNATWYNRATRASQLRMGRAAVRWGVRELASKAGVAVNTVARIENGADAKQSTMDALQRALEAAGVEFTNGERPGVRLIKPAEAPASPRPAATRRAKTSKRQE
jgi:transcriptional regulator with XRE-family HTH domain